MANLNAAQHATIRENKAELRRLALLPVPDQNMQHVLAWRKREAIKCCDAIDRVKREAVQAEHDEQ